MSYIKTYKLFIENSSFEDDALRTQINDIKKQISEFKSKKSSIDSIYNGKYEDTEVKSKIEQILGRDEKSRNPFMVEYVTVSKLNRKLTKTVDKLAQCKLDLTELRSSLNTVTDNILKTNINTKINDLNKKILDYNKEIRDITKDISDKNKEFDEKLSKVDKDIKDKISKLSSNI